MTFSPGEFRTVPVNSFDWYLVFIEDEFVDGISDEIKNNFTALGKEVGKNVLVVRGLNAKKFREDFIEAKALFEEKWSVRIDVPALLIMNRASVEVMNSAKDLDATKVVCFPLGPIYESRNTIIPFLKEVAQACRNPQAFEGLDDLNPSGVRKFWEWLTKYLEIKPSAFGISIDLGRAISEL